MNFQRKKVATALAYVLGASGAVTLLAGPAQAADIKVEVTGSNIKRIEGEGALPVQVIRREEIDQSGATNAMEIMNLISANNSAGNVSLGNVIGATTFSNQTASLRGLGGSSTLVLVNGKRLGTFAGGISGAEGVNLAAIPFAAIERVEVLKDGASAIYGSDAIGGVINFIMRQDFTGRRRDGLVRRADAQRRRRPVSVAWRPLGWGDLTKDKYNAFFSVNYPEQKSLDQSDRNFSKTSYIPRIGLNTTSGQTFPGFISTGDRRRHRQPGYPNCGAVESSSARAAASTRRATAGVESIPDTKQLNLFGSGALPDQRRLAGVPDRPVLDSRKRSSSSSRRRSPTRSSRRRRRPATSRRSSLPADQPVLPARSSRPATASTASRSTSAIAASFAATATRPTPTRLADRRRRQGHGVELGLRRLVQLQREHAQGKAERRLLPVTRRSCRC